MTARGEDWFWHVLALALGKTVGELQRTMTMREFRDWISFYNTHPFDDMHRYHRPAALVARSMSGADMQELLDWLQPPAWHADLADSDLATLKAFGIRK